MPTTAGSCGFRLGLAAARGGFGAPSRAGLWGLGAASVPDGLRHQVGPVGTPGDRRAPQGNQQPFEAFFLYYYYYYYLFLIFAFLS